MSSLKLNVANVAKPQASAVRAANAGNCIIMYPDPEKCFSFKSWSLGKGCVCERFPDNEQGSVILVSGAGVSIWPTSKLKNFKVLPKQKGLRMVAAKETEIKNEGQKRIKFRGA